MKEPFVVQEKDLSDMAHKVIETLASSRSTEEQSSSRVLFLEGDLGAGKTTFTKELASALGVDKEEVHSPTFILKKEYKTGHPLFKKLIHVDAYRFDTPKEAKVLKIDDDIKSGDSLIVIEWPSKLGGELDEDMTISFSVVDDDTREIMVNYAFSR